MDFVFFTKKLLSSLILPPASFVLLGVAGLALLRRLPRLGLTLAWLSLIGILTLSLPVTSAHLMALAADTAPVDRAAARQAQAIVILGGGRRFAPEYGGETVSEMTLERVRYGATLARELDLPILVTGGTVYGRGTPEGILMARTLEQSFGVPARWVESQSRDTKENARFAAQLLRIEDIRKIVLVTHDYHQRRSLAEFRAAGFIALPAPVTFAPPLHGRTFLEHLPSANALRISAAALHELLGYLVLASDTPDDEPVARSAT
jgi:uncharacterized SAM-binding protein YcdF (DUF218 family)